MSTKLTATHKWILLILAFILINVALWMYGLSPMMKKVDAAQQELDQVRSRRDGLQAELDRLVAIDADALKAQMEEASVRLPANGKLREFIHYFVDLAEDYSIVFDEITVAPPTLEEPYYCVTLTAPKMEGKYAQLKKLLITLEEHKRLILVRGFNVKDADPDLEASISFSLYAEGFDPLKPVEATGRADPFAAK